MENKFFIVFIIFYIYLNAAQYEIIFYFSLYAIFKSQIVLYFLHSILILSFYINIVLTLSMWDRYKEDNPLVYSLLQDSNYHCSIPIDVRLDLIQQLAKFYFFSLSITRVRITPQYSHGQNVLALLSTLLACRPSISETGTFQNKISIMDVDVLAPKVARTTSAMVFNTEVH